jgi:hypothetical protein
MLGYDGDAQVLVLGEHEGGGEADDACSGIVSVRC